MENIDEINREEARIAHATAREGQIKLFDSVISSGLAALRTVLTVNAGGVIALLGFLGTVADKSLFDSVDPFKWPFISFAAGVALALLGIGGMYFSQAFYQTGSEKQRFDYEHPYVHDTDVSRRLEARANCFRGLTILFATLSLAAFLIGLIQSYGLLLAAEI